MNNDDNEKKVNIYDVENINSIEKLKALGFEGSDASLEESLYEYGLAWMQDPENPLALYFIHIASNSMIDGDPEQMDFDSTTITEEDFMSCLSDRQINGCADYCGMTVEEWKSQWFPRKVEDMMRYSGVDDVFGTSYGTFKIHPESLGTI